MKKILAGLGGLMLGLCWAGASPGQDILGQAAGNGGDTNPATFHFSPDNQNFQMLDKSGNVLTRENIAIAYSEACRIYVNGQDAVTALGLTVAGADLSGYDWTSNTYPASGRLAIDPATGRFKFPAWTAAISGPMPIDVVLSANSFINPVLDINAEGAVFCVFRENPFPYANYAARFQPDFGWSAPERVDGNQNGEVPKIAVNDAGAALCVKERYIASDNRDVYADFYAPGSGWAGDVMVYNPLTVTVLALDAALANSGRGLMWYNAFLSGHYHLMAREFNPLTMVWSGETPIDSLVNTASVSSNNVPMAIDKSTGEVICIFLQDSGWGTGSALYANHYRPNAGGWMGAQMIAPPNASDPAVAINSQGEAICVYCETTGTKIVYATYYTPGIGWHGKDQVCIGNSSSNFTLKVAMDREGDAVCAINDTGNTPNQILGPLYRRGAGWGSLRVVSNANNENAFLRNLVMNENGLAVCSFTQKPSSTGNTRGYINVLTKNDDWQGAVMADAGFDIETSSMTLGLTNRGFLMIAIAQNDGIRSRIYARSGRLQIPGGDMQVNYSAAAGTIPTATATAGIPAPASIKITGRKILPGSGQKAQINYSLSRAGWVKIVVYNLAGDKIISLADAYHAAGTYSATWGAENAAGSLIASGVYILHIKTPDLERNEKVVVIK